MYRNFRVEYKRAYHKRLFSGAYFSFYIDDDVKKALLSKSGLVTRQRVNAIRLYL